MVELSPSNDEVKRHVAEEEARAKRVAALVAVAQDLASLLTPGSKEVESLQSILDILNKEALLLVGDALWTAHAAADRIRQVEQLSILRVA